MASVHATAYTGEPHSPLRRGGGAFPFDLLVSPTYPCRYRRLTNGGAVVHAALPTPSSTRPLTSRVSGRAFLFARNMGDSASYQRANFSPVFRRSGTVTTNLGGPMLRTYSGRSFTTLYFDSEGGGGGGGSSSGEGESGNDNSGGQGSSGDNDVASHLDPDRLVAEHGDARQALGALSAKLDKVESDNADYREELRQLRDQVPDDESVVLDPDTVERLRDKGYIEDDDPSAEEVVTALEREREARTRLENQQTFNEVVRVTGANRDALEDLGADDLPYEIKEVDGDDGTQKKVVVETEDGEKEFDQYIKDEYPTFADTILNGDGGGSGSSSPSIPNQPSGEGSSNNSGGPATDVDEFLEQENESRGRA